MRFAIAILAALALAAPGSAGAAPAPDRLLEPSAPSRTVPAARSRAAAALAGELGRFGVVDIDPRTARPRVVARLDGTLTGPRDAPAERIVVDYLREHAALFGDGGGLELARSYTSRGRVTRLVFEQRVDGALVLDGGLVANVTTDGRLVNVIGAPRPDVAVAAPAIDASQARRRAGEISGGSAAATPTSGLQTERAVLADRPAWRTFVTAPGGGLDEVVVDAVTGAALRVRSLTRDGKALVFDNSPGAPVGGTQRQVELGAYVTAPGGPQLYGPFAYVTADEDDDDVVDPGEDIPASAGTDYLYPYTPFQSVAGVTCAAPAFCSWNRNQPFSWRTNRNQAAVNAFYLASLFHDHLRASPIEFTPAKGAFEGNNRVWIDVADGAALAGGLPDAVHRNNAFNNTPPTGPAFMTFLLYTETSRDSADEAATIFHEYTHGMSARLMAGPGGVNTLVGHQSESINEATSDWHAADFLTAGGQQTDTAAPGEIHVGLGRSQGLDCPVGAVSAACPGSPDAGPGGYTYGDLGHVIDQPEDHADGEIWGETLWDLRRRLIALHGTALGVEWAELLVTAGMELSPGEPSFLDMRNAILEADAIYQGGHYALLWSVFAARGMGFFAADVGSRDTRPAEDFSLPPSGAVGTIAGTVRTDAGVPVTGARVTVGGLRGYAGTTTNAEGHFSLASMDVGTYPRVYASAGGGLDLGVATDVVVTAGATTTREIVLRRDWASSAGGGRVVSATGNDDPRPGWCGPGDTIDQDSATNWRTDSPALVPGPKLLTLELAEPIDVTSVEIDPSPGCNAGSTAMLGGWRLELSRDGQTFVPAASGTFGIANGFRRNPVTPAAGTGFGVRYVRLVALSSRDSSNPEFTGARYLTVTDVGVYGGRADLSAPDTSISGGPPEGGLVASRDALLTFGASEAGAGFECRLDGSAWTACDAGQAAYSGLADGVHAFEARARDARGNLDATPATRGWSIDATPPETEITQGPAEGSTSEATDVTFGFGSEAGAAFHCRLDGEAWAPCASPRRWTDLAGGDHVVEVRAQDRAGNVDATPARRGWRVVTRPLASRTATYTIAAQRIAAVRSRGLRVAYSCLASCTLRWELRLDAAQVRRLKLGRRELVVGKATSRRTSAGRGSASIKLSARAGRALRRAARVTFTLRVSGAASAPEERRVVVRR